MPRSPSPACSDVGFFPPVRLVQAVICQRMVPTISGKMTPALEIMINTSTVKKMIEENRLDKLAAAIEKAIENAVSGKIEAILVQVVEKAVTREIEKIKKAKREAIIVTKIPYQVNKASLVEKIAELVKDKKINSISEVRDESDRHGLRVGKSLLR